MIKMGIIAIDTFIGLARDKILYNVLFIALFLLWVGYWASLLVYGHQDRVMLHFGLMVNSFAILGIGISSGARLFYRELDSKIIYLILSRSVSRTEYWWGKVFGLGLFLAMNLLFLTFTLAIGVVWVGGSLHFIPLVQSASLLWVESWLTGAFALGLGLFLRPPLAIMVSITYLFICRGQEQIGIPALMRVLLVNAESFSIGTRVFYDLPLLFIDWFSRFGYGLIWLFIFILLGNALFYRKNL